MAHEVETMAYAGQVPWHGLGKAVSSDMTPAEMQKAAGLDWTVSKREIFLKTDQGELGARVPDQYALTRDTDERVLSIVGRNFKPTPNEEIFDFFKRYVTAGDMSLETAGSLRDGQFIWALAKINASFTLGKSGDDVHPYLLMMQPHMYGFARTVKFTPVRVVCQNTLTAALGAGFAGDKTPGKVFKMTNARKFDDSAKEEAQMALGIAVQQAKEFEEVARLLARKKASKDAVEKYFRHILDYDPEEAKKKLDGSIREPSMLVKFRDALHTAPGQDLSSAKGKWWGALNAVTNVIDHRVGHSRDTALSSAWVGDNALIKRKALELAIAEAS